MPRTKKSISFEDKLKELENTVNSMEDGNLQLEDMMEKYQAGKEIVKQLEKQLEEAKQKLFVLDDDDKLIETKKAE